MDIFGHMYTMYGGWVCALYVCNVFMSILNSYVIFGKHETWLNVITKVTSYMTYAQCTFLKWLSELTQKKKLLSNDSF